MHVHPELFKLIKYNYSYITYLAFSRSGCGKSDTCHIKGLGFEAIIMTSYNDEELAITDPDQTRKVAPVVSYNKAANTTAPWHMHKCHV